MLRELYGRNDFGLLYLLAAVIAGSFVLGWLGIRKSEAVLLRKESLEIALQWNRSLLNNLDNVEKLLATGQHSDHDLPLFRLATEIGGIVRHKVYNSESRVVAASSPKDVGKINKFAYFRDVVRNGQSHVIVDEPDTANGKTKIIARAYVPFMAGRVFKGAFEVYLDVTSRAAHVRKIGNLAIGGLILVLVSISGVGGILVFRNIDYRRRQRDVLGKAMVRAESASRSKSEFLASMSHEIRTPLNAINGFSEIIAGQHFGPVGVEKYQEYAQDIHDSGRLLLSLINDILDISKAEAGKLDIHEEAVMVENIVNTGLRMTSDRARKKNLRLYVEIEDELPALFCDERLLLQTLLNFLSNAMKFTPRGGAITIRASLNDDGGIDLVVEDNGVGISPEDIPKVLEPFGQAGNSISGKREGTGLGLPLAKKFIECHGGQFNLSSILGEGTKVSAHFPESRVLHKVS